MDSKSKRPHMFAMSIWKTGTVDPLYGAGLGVALIRIWIWLVIPIVNHLINSTQDMKS